MNNTDTEIDLLELFINILLFFKRSIKFFIASLLIGVIIALIYYTMSTPVYESSATISSSNKRIFINMLESLNEQLTPYNLSNKFNINEDVAKSVVKIEPEIIFIEPIDEEDTKKEASYFKVKVTVLDSSVFSVIEDGLRFFAENNEYTKQNFQIDKSQRSELIEYLNKEIKKLDSLRLLENKNTQGVLLVEDNKSTLNKDILDYFVQKQKLEKTNQLAKIFRVIKGFEKGLYPQKDKSTPLYIILITLLLGFLVAVFIALSKKLEKYENKVDK